MFMSKVTSNLTCIKICKKNIQNFNLACPQKRIALAIIVIHIVPFSNKAQDNNAQKLKLLTSNPLMVEGLQWWIINLQNCTLLFWWWCPHVHSTFNILHQTSPKRCSMSSWPVTKHPSIFFKRKTVSSCRHQSTTLFLTPPFPHPHLHSIKKTWPGSANDEKEQYVLCGCC